VRLRGLIAAEPGLSQLLPVLEPPELAISDHQIGRGGASKAAGAPATALRRLQLAVGLPSPSRRDHAAHTTPLTPHLSTGFAAVFRGSLKREGLGSMPVAVKTLLRGDMDVGALLREVRLAMAAAQACNGVCPVLGATVHRDAIAFVSPLYERNAADEAEDRAGGLPPLAALSIMEPAARALQIMHGNGELLLVYTHAPSPIVSASFAALSLEHPPWAPAGSAALSLHRCRLTNAGTLLVSLRCHARQL